MTSICSWIGKPCIINCIAHQSNGYFLSDILACIAVSLWLLNKGLFCSLHSSWKIMQICSISRNATFNLCIHAVCNCTASENLQQLCQVLCQSEQYLLHIFKGFLLSDTLYNRKGLTDKERFILAAIHLKIYAVLFFNFLQKLICLLQDFLLSFSDSCLKKISTSYYNSFPCRMILSIDIQTTSEQEISIKKEPPSS